MIRTTKVVVPFFLVLSLTLSGCSLFSTAAAPPPTTLTACPVAINIPTCDSCQLQVLPLRSTTVRGYMTSMPRPYQNATVVVDQASGPATFPVKTMPTVCQTFAQPLPALATRPSTAHLCLNYVSDLSTVLCDQVALSLK